MYRCKPRRAEITVLTTQSTGKASSDRITQGVEPLANFGVATWEESPHSKNSRGSQPDPITIGKKTVTPVYVSDGTFYLNSTNA